MPYVACESLQQRIDREGPLEPKEVLRIGLQVAAGLAAAHAQGLVHRDVKPANILLEKTVDRVMLTDFGLARAVDDASLTRTGVIAGTPQYMSPEQARGESVDQRSDLFSLGGVMYAMCTGRPPFRGETSYGVLRRITDTEPRSIREVHPEIPDWLERIVQQLLAKSREERFPSADEVAELLQRCLAHLQQPTQVELPPQYREVTANKRVISPRSLFAAVVVLIVLLIVAIASPHFKKNVRSTDRLAGDRVTAETTEPSASTTTTSPAAMEAAAIDNDTDWDASSRFLQAYVQEFEAFESAAQQNWNHQPRSLREQ
jgi:serine/threonine-protein kinase